MFGNIAARYDLLNHLLSGNIDKTVEAVSCENALRNPCLQWAQGSNPGCCVRHRRSLASRCLKAGQARIIGMDFCRPMLQIAKSKAAKQGFEFLSLKAMRLQLPFADRSFDAVTIAFGLRNLTSVEAGFKELLRVLKPGGKIAVLEFSKPVDSDLAIAFQILFHQGAARSSEV